MAKKRTQRLERPCSEEALSKHARWYIERLSDWPEEYLRDDRGELLGPDRLAELRALCHQLAARLRAGEVGQPEDEDRALREIIRALPEEVRNGLEHINKLIMNDEMTEDLLNWME